MTGLNMTVGVIGIVIEHEVGGVSVKDSNNLAFDVPVLEVGGEQVDVANEKGHIAVQHQLADVEHDIRLFQSDRNVDLKFLIGLGASGGFSARFAWPDFSYSTTQRTLIGGLAARAPKDHSARPGAPSGRTDGR
jgi:hypothetical protein